MPSLLIVPIDSESEAALSVSFLFAAEAAGSAADTAASIITSDSKTAVERFNTLILII